MAIVSCPYCGSAIRLKEAKPGRYQPKCPQCAKKFNLKVIRGALHSVRNPSRIP